MTCMPLMLVVENNVILSALTTIKFQCTPLKTSDMNVTLK